MEVHILIIFPLYNLILGNKKYLFRVEWHALKITRVSYSQVPIEKSLANKFIQD